MKNYLTNQYKFDIINYIMKINKKNYHRGLTFDV